MGVNFKKIEKLKEKKEKREKKEDTENTMDMIMKFIGTNRECLDIKGCKGRIIHYDPPITIYHPIIKENIRTNYLASFSKDPKKLDNINEEFVKLHLLFFEKKMVVIAVVQEELDYIG